MSAVLPTHPPERHRVPDWRGHFAVRPLPVPDGAPGAGRRPGYQEIMHLYHGLKYLRNWYQKPLKRWSCK